MPDLIKSRFSQIQKGDIAPGLQLKIATSDGQCSDVNTATRIETDIKHGHKMSLIICVISKNTRSLIHVDLA